MNKKELIVEIACELYFADFRRKQNDGRAFYKLSNQDKGYYYHLAKTSLNSINDWGNIEKKGD